MNFLIEKILAEKRAEIKRLRAAHSPIRRGNDLHPIRNFKEAISLPNAVSLIAEIKFHSPSEGIIRENGNPVSLARIYQRAGAVAVSVVTDKRFFGGDLGHLPLVRRAISLPVLRKDFIIDELQVKESFTWGADAVLLIARILSLQKLKSLLEITQDLGMVALTEVHDEEDLMKAIDGEAEIIGINNRNLDTFEVDLDTTRKLAPRVPEGKVLVCESGIRKREDIRSIKPLGVHGFLIGTALMKSENLEMTARELAGETAGHGQD
jgi:indole-3-glycerol phosphate synthase